MTQLTYTHVSPALAPWTDKTVRERDVVRWKGSPPYVVVEVGDDGWVELRSELISVDGDPPTWAVSPQQKGDEHYPLALLARASLKAAPGMQVEWEDGGEPEVIELAELCEDGESWICTDGGTWLWNAAWRLAGTDGRQEVVA